MNTNYSLNKFRAICVDPRLSVSKFLVLFIAMALLVCSSVSAADDGLQAIPEFGARVTDLTHTLTSQQDQELATELAALEQRKGSRVAVLMLPTTQPEDIAQYSIRVTDAWKLSRTDKQAQDGVLLIVAKDDHRVRIEVGRDLEGAIPDAAADRIIREYITPKFRAGDFYGGVHDAVGALTKLIDGEPLPPPLTGSTDRQSENPFNTLFIVFMVVLWARAFLGRVPAAPRSGLIGAIAGALAWFISGLLPVTIGAVFVGLLLGWLGGGGGGFAGRGGFGGWSGGGFGAGNFGGGGGFGSGGFSGGSSGGFAGGGASGSW